jgi:hypothetical protein
MKRLDELFHIKYGSQLDLNKCERCDRPDGYNFVNRSATNCGVAARILPPKGKTPYPAGAITTAMGGSVLASFVQQEPFFTGQNVKVLTPKKPMTLQEKLYYCACIEANRFRYSAFGREANASFDGLAVPSPNEIPKDALQKDTKESFIANPIGKSISLDVENWQPFLIGNLFEIKKGKRLTKDNMTEGDIPFIGSTNGNNGQTATVGNNQNLHPAGLITVSYNGSIAEAFYQPRPFVASDDINVLYPRFSITKYSAIFLCTVISCEKYRFCYGRKWHKELMEESVIKLPATPQGTPDWKHMEDYIKGLPYSANI